MKPDLRSVPKQLSAASGTDISKRAETVLGYLLAAAIGTSLAILLVVGLSK